MNEKIKIRKKRYETGGAAVNITGDLMSKDTVIAEINNSSISAVNEALLPLYLKRASGIESWLESRAIDTHRTNSRLLKKALRLTTADDVAVALKVNAATVTDTYWFRPDDSELSYSDIRFKENMFDKLALYGDPDSFNNEYSRTPELTNIGSFEKCWRLENGAWWLYKQANELELFSELFICELGKAVGFNMAHYEKDGKYIRSRDFTNGAAVNYEPAEGLVGGDEDYTVNFNALANLSENCIGDYIKTIYMDTLCFNMHRHTKNYGILRNADSGEVLGMAPNFDNNIALVSRGYPQRISRENDRLIQLFGEFLESSGEALDCFVELDIPEVDRAVLESCMDKVPLDVDRGVICEFILNGQSQINEAVQRLTQNTKLGQSFN